MKNLTPKPTAIHLKDYLPSAYLIDTVDLNFNLEEDTTTVIARLAIRRNPLHQSANPPLVLFGEQLNLIAIALDNTSLTKLDYQVNDQQLVITNVPEQFVLDITTQIKPQNNTALSGLYRSNSIFCTQCEAEGFRRITYFIDRPDVLACYTTTITADKTLYPVLLSNGNLIGKGEASNNRHWVTWEDPFKKPSYLFALVAGDLEYLQDLFITRSGRKVALKVFVDKGNLDKGSYAMHCIKLAMDWDERVYNCEYDLDIFMVVAINDFNMGAMENKGLNIFNAKYILANRDIATDVDYQNILRVVGHEYFHNWSGNRVTCRDWFQLSLKEGLTIFREQDFFADMTSAAVARIEEVRLLRGRQFMEDAGPLAHPVRPDSYIEINNFYTMTIYHKGSEVIRMLHTFLGKEKFFQAMELYFSRYDGQAVTIDDFVKVMEEVSGEDFSQFRLWYSQAGTPELIINSEYNAEQQTFTLHVKQECAPTPGQPEKFPYYLPLAVGLLDPQGKNQSLQLATDKKIDGDTYILPIKKAEQTFTFVNIKEKPVPALLRGFSAPVKVRADYTDADLLFLLQHESDGFCRWDAGFQLACRIMLALIKSYQEKPILISDHKLSAALKNVFNDQKLDKAFIAELLILPAESYLGSLLPVIDVQAIHAVHRFVRYEIADYLKDIFWEYYQQESTSEKTGVHAHEMVGRRRLKNLCLHYLMLLKDDAIRAACVAQFQHSNNMTDRLAALTALVNAECIEREEALLHFYQRYEREPLVLDKWLAIQAASEAPGALARVKQLMSHPAFNIKNPNKVHALIGTFVGQNQLQFHDITGEGYQFLAEQIITLDKLNPQVAARLLEPFTRWRRYDEQRQELMRKQLERIAAVENLSKDSYEIVEKSLHS